MMPESQQRESILRVLDPMIPDAARAVRALIIGAGPAGLFAAASLAEALGDGRGIIVLERGAKPGRKLLASGSGQCNITHAGGIEDFLGRYAGGAKPGAAARFLKPALYAFGNEDLLEWFRARGIGFETDDNGKVFPASRRASTILGALQAECLDRGVRIVMQSRVMGIGRAQDASDYVVQVEGTAGADDAAWSAPLVLICTGGASYPRLGSTGDGYALAASLGHHVVPPRPALAPVFIRDFPLADLAGLSFRDAGLVIRREGEKPVPRSGDLLVTHTGLSGPLILDASGIMQSGDRIEVRFTPRGADEFRSALDAALKASPRRQARGILAEMDLPRAMAERFCDLAGLDPGQTAADLSRPARDALCRFACAFPFVVDRLGDYDTAMATAGGIDLGEIRAATMESRIASGLYFAGELLDIVGDTGGYNLQAAFSTARLAALSMAAAVRTRLFPR